MAVTAQSLRNTGVQTRELRWIVEKQLEIIDIQIIRANNTLGKNTLNYILPTYFGIVGVQKIDAQRFIYASIIMSLQERGFHTRINIQHRPEKITLSVMWDTGISPEQMRTMDRYIMQKNKL